MLLLTTMCSEKQLGVAIFFPLQQKNETNSFFLELQTTSQNIQEIKVNKFFFLFTKNRSVKFEFNVLVLRLSVNYATFLGKLKI